jgi:hypothetical protein
MRMRSVLVGLVLAAAAIPAASFATPADKTDKTNANKACTSLRTSLGASTFANTYGSFGACVSKMTQTARLARLQATTECRGKPHHSTCVNSKTQTNLNTQANSTKNAAKACAAQLRSAGVQSFIRSWGTNHNLRNAFGKCVSAHSKSSSQPHTSTSTTVTVTTSTATSRFEASLASVNNSDVTGDAQLFLTGNQLTVALSVHKFDAGKTPVANIVAPSSGSNACPANVGTTELGLGVNVVANNGGNLAFAGHYTYESSTLGALDTRAIALYSSDGKTLVACGQVTH